MSKLSLTTRKNIQENEAKRIAHLKKINTACGIQFETEIDWLPIAPVVEERGYKDRVGEVVYDWYLGGLASNVESFCKDPIQKESFVETFGERKTISFHLEESQYDNEDSPHRYNYSWTTNNGGVLEIHVPKDKIPSNVSDTGADLTKTCSGDSALSVATRKNIADSAKSLAAALKTMKTATGIDFDTEFDWVPLAAVTKERGYEDRSGDVVHDWYMKALASNIDTFCKDPIQKEAFLETFKERHLITLVLEESQYDNEDSPHRYNYSWTKNNGGVLELHVPKDKLPSNVSDAGNDLTKTCSGDSALNVATRKNIQDQEATRKKHMTKLTKATGVDWELEVDWVVFANNAAERGYADRVGEIVYDWYLGALVSNIETLVKDDMSKEAFLESASKKVIAFHLATEEGEMLDGYAYSQCTFTDDGALKVSIPKEKMPSNVSDCGKDIESRL